MEKVMIEIIGKYNSAKCFTNNLETTAREQIQTVCDQKWKSCTFNLKIKCKKRQAVVALPVGNCDN